MTRVTITRSSVRAGIRHAAFFALFGSMLACAATVDDQGPPVATDEPDAAHVEAELGSVVAEADARAHDHAGHSAHDHHGDLLIVENESERLAEPGPLRLVGERPFRAIAVWAEGPRAAELRWRVPDGEWKPLERTWFEAPISILRAASDEPISVIEVDGAQGLDFLKIEGIQVPYDPLAPLARDLPFESERDLLEEDRILHSVPGFAVTRAGWGARASQCTFAHTPQIIAVHHTVTPSNESNPAQRMRGMQTFHMDGHGWCDIGYHFVPAPNGEVYQGVPILRRGVHVGGNNTNNIGVSFMGTFTTDQPTTAQFDVGARTIRWITDTYGIALNRDRVRGHRQWNATACPGNALYPRLGELVTRAGTINDPPPPPPPPPEPDKYEVSFDVALDAGDGLNMAGSLDGMAQVATGDRVIVNVVMENASTAPIRGNRVSVDVGDGLRIVHWRIESDHPNYDQSTWVPNSANDADENPPRQAPARSTFDMHAFSPEESKRLQLELEATESTLHRDPAFVRVWLQNVDDLYGPQSDFGVAPDQNELDAIHEAERVVHIAGRDHWFFASDADPADTDGWRACAEATPAALQQDTAARALLIQPSAQSGDCADAPPWTRVDAEAWDELVLFIEPQGDLDALDVQWAAADQPHDGLRFFSAAIGGETGPLLVRLGDLPTWEGIIERLRLTPVFEDGAEDTALRVDRIFFQNGSERTTSAPDEPWVDAPAASAWDPDAADGSSDDMDGASNADAAPVPGDPGETGNGGEGNAGNDRGATRADGRGAERVGDSAVDGSSRGSSGGCTIVDSSKGGGSDWPLPLMLMLGVFLLRRRG